jgi:hypothetical protein
VGEFESALKGRGFTGCGKIQEVSGHDFSRADKASKMSRALQAAEKFNPRGFVTGHDFSRADKAGKTSRALAPANPSFAEFAFRSDFFRAPERCFS